MPGVAVVGAGLLAGALEEVAGADSSGGALEVVGSALCALACEADSALSRAPVAVVDRGLEALTVAVAVVGGAEDEGCVLSGAADGEVDEEPARGSVGVVEGVPADALADALAVAEVSVEAPAGALLEVAAGAEVLAPSAGLVVCPVGWPVGAPSGVVGGADAGAGVVVLVDPPGLVVVGAGTVTPTSGAACSSA